MNNFLKSFYKLAGLAQVSTVGVLDDGKMLWGKRRDNGKWTCAGGHLNPGEDPLDGAVRELREETGIKVYKSKLTHVKSEKVTTPKGKQLIVHAYVVKLSGVPTTMRGDPDKEVFSWKWISIKDGLPDFIVNNLHSPKNVLLKGMGLQPKETDMKKEARGGGHGGGHSFGGFYGTLPSDSVSKEELLYELRKHEERETPAQEKQESAKEQDIEERAGVEKKAFLVGFEKAARKLTSKSRNNLPSGDFVFPETRRYPIMDEAHARNALARASGKSEESKVRAAVKRKYPEIE